MDGFILQGPVSDRENLGIMLSPKEIRESIAHADRLISAGKQDETMPPGMIDLIFKTPVTAYRWRSMAAPGYVTKSPSSPGQGPLTYH